MKGKDILKALVHRIDSIQPEEGVEYDLVLVSASATLLQAMLSGTDVASFDFQNDGNIALLLKAVASITPEALNEDDWAVIRLVENHERTESQRS